MSNGTLKLAESRIFYIEDQKEKSLSADEIYSAFIEHNYNTPLTKEICQQLASLVQFSRYPADINIALEVMPEKRSVSVFLECRTPDGDRSRIQHEQNPEDHIVINKTWYPLRLGDVKELSSILVKAGITANRPLTLRQYMDLQNICATNNIDLSIKSDPSLIESDYFFNAALPDINSIGLNADLYEYQKTGWRWLSSLFREGLGGILGDEMGLGKTMQIIALLTSEIKDKSDPALIICPSTLLENWRREIEKFSTELTTLVHQGQRRTGNPKNLAGFNVIISSYDTVVRDTALFSQIHWKIIILDEAQAIKNPDTNRSVWIKQLPRQSAFAVTGTPVENRLSDLWSIMDFVMPGYLGDQKDFKNKYEDSIDGASRLEPVVSPLLLRRRVARVAKDLPERIDIPQWLEMPYEEAKLYEELRQKIIADMDGNAALPVLTKLRMFCTHPKLIDEDADILNSSAKYQRLVEIVEEIFENGSKVIVFSSYTKMADFIVADIKERFGVYTNFIDGRTPIASRQDVVDEFSQHEGPALLSLNPKAAGSGLNITAANHVIHYNLEWNPATEDQASARAHRRGQKLPVTIHRLIYSKTVEEGIDGRLQRKRGLAENAVVGVDSSSELQDIMQCLNFNPADTNNGI